MTWRRAFKGKNKAELFSVVMAVSIFVITWNARRFLQKGYLPLLQPG